MRIVVLDGYTLNPGDGSWQPVAALGDLVVHDRTPVDLVVGRAREADVVLTNKTPLGAQSLAQLTNLKFISVLATGYNIVDVAAAGQRGVPVSNVPEYSTNSVAEHVFAMVLEFYHHCGRLSQLVHEGHWQRCVDFSFWEHPLWELSGKTIGIVGFGRIGRRVAALAHAFGMNVIAYDVRQADPPDFEPFGWRPLEALFSEADVVTIHCPQTADNTGLVNRRLVSRMKRTAILINAARGGLINEQELADCLNEELIAGAAVDVLSVEPPDETNPLLRAKDCLITPHVAWATVEARQRMMQVTAANIAAFQQGRPQNVVNERNLSKAK